MSMQVRLSVICTCSCPLLGVSVEIPLYFGFILCTYIMYSLVPGVYLIFLTVCTSQMHPNPPQVHILLTQQYNCTCTDTLHCCCNSCG